MKFLAVTIFQFISGSLYTDENLYHEDKADGKQGVPDGRSDYYFFYFRGY